MFEYEETGQIQRNLLSRMTLYTPELARMILCAAGGRLMANEKLTPEGRALGGEYLGLMLDGVESMEACAAANGQTETMVSLETQIYGARNVMMECHGDPTQVALSIPPDAAALERAKSAGDAMEAVRNAIGDAYADYRHYEEMCPEDPKQTARLTWTWQQ